MLLPPCPLALHTVLYDTRATVIHRSRKGISHACRVKPGSQRGARRYSGPTPLATAAAGVGLCAVLATARARTRPIASRDRGGGTITSPHGLLASRASNESDWCNWSGLTGGAMLSQIRKPFTMMTVALDTNVVVALVWMTVIRGRQWRMDWPCWSWRRNNGTAWESGCVESGLGERSG